jgi:hypothetical protein
MVACKGEIGRSIQFVNYMQSQKGGEQSKNSTGDTCYYFSTVSWTAELTRKEKTHER